MCLAFYRIHCCILNFRIIFPPNVPPATFSGERGKAKAKRRGIKKFFPPIKSNKAFRNPWESEMQKVSEDL